MALLCIKKMVKNNGGKEARERWTESTQEYSPRVRETKKWDQEETWVASTAVVKF